MSEDAPVLCQTGQAPGCLQAALDYVKRGWRVIPVPGGCKNPGYAGWEQTRLSEEELPQYFGNGSNIGVLLGQPSGGLVDVDLDCPEALVVAPELLPPTDLIHGRPGSRSSHWWYKVSSPSRTIKLEDPDGGTCLVELRSTGGQTIVPPSRHPSGEALAWAQGGDPAQANGADLVARVKRIGAIALLARHWPGRGSRDKASMALAGVLLRGGMLMEDAEHFIGLVARAAGDDEVSSRARAAADTFQKLSAGLPITGIPTLEELVGEKIVTRAREWLGLRAVRPGQTTSAAQQPVEWDAPVPLTNFSLPPFPTQALPQWLREFVEAEATASQTPPDLTAMLALSVLAAASAKKVVVEVKDGYQEPLNIFTVTVLPPGNRKSAVFSAVVRPLEDWERSEIEHTRPEIAKEETRYRIAGEALKRAESAASKASLEGREELTREADQLAREYAEMKVPMAPRFIVDDCSPERLATLLRDQNGRIAVMAPEGDVFDLMAGRYSSTGAANLGVFLRGHAGDDLRVDRVGRPAEFVKAPALTMGLAVQPEVLRGLTRTPSFRGRGLIGRFLYSAPRSLLGARNPDAPPMPHRIRESYRQHVRDLLALSVPTDPQGALIANPLGMEAAALRKLQAFERALEPELAESGDLGHMTDWAGKLTGAVVRLAGILHMAEWVGECAPWEIPISEESVEHALQIGQYLTPHARAAYGEMGADEDLDAARHLLDRIEGMGKERFSKRELFAVTRGRFKRVTSMEPALALLEENGYIRSMPTGEREGPGRRRSPTYEVNPLVLAKGAAAGSAGPRATQDGGEGNSVDCGDSVVGGRP